MERNLRSWAVVALVGAAAVAVATASDSRVLASNIGITLYPDGHALMQVPYRRDAPQGTVRIRVEGTEVIAGFPAQPRKYWNNNYVFAVPDDMPEQVPVEVVFTGPSRTQTVRTTVRPTRLRSAAPDGDDAPTVAARSMVALAKRHAADDKLPANAETMRAELAGDLKSDFVAGLDLWAKKKGLPVRTERLGDAKGRTTLDAMKVALNRGDAAELILDGRMVNLVDIDGAFILFDDPRGPIGTTVYIMDGTHTIGWGFSSQWCGMVQCL